jgi:tetratricopeptide (TPR) repeat protein
VECPSDARAFEGLSVCYLMLATFGMRSPRETYPRFLEAHERAVSLCGLRPELRCNRAHGLHLFERRYVEAEAEFLRALDDKPTLVSSYVRLAMLYATVGRTDAALEVLSRGRAIDPLLPTLPTMEMVARFFRREFDETIAIGTTTVALHPHLQIARAIYAQALEYSDRLEEALDQYRTGALTSPDLLWLRALEGTCLAKMGRHDQSAAILEELERRRDREYVDPYFMASFRSALGHYAQALDELERACHENSAWLYGLDWDPKMDAIRPDPRFASIRASLAPALDSF